MSFPNRLSGLLVLIRVWLEQLWKIMKVTRWRHSLAFWPSRAAQTNANRLPIMYIEHPFLGSGRVIYGRFPCQFKCRNTGFALCAPDFFDCMSASKCLMPRSSLESILSEVRKWLQPHLCTVASVSTVLPHAPDCFHRVPTFKVYTEEAMEKVM